MPTDEELIARILEDKETHVIAESLGLDAGEYAARVLFYLKNPKADPQLTLLTPEQEKAAGVPSPAEVMDFARKMESGEIDTGPAHNRSQFAGFDDEEKSAITAAGGQAKKEAPKAESSGLKPAPPVVAKRGLAKK